MNASSFQDSSLYELAASIEQVSQPLQVSPTTFKSMLSAIMDVLSEAQEPATLWMKLPRGYAWSSEVERYQRSTHPDSAIYILKNPQSAYHTPEESDRPPSRPAPSGDSNIFDWDSDADSDIHFIEPLPSPFTICSATSLPLAAHSQLRREYFLMVRSPRFSVLLLAHRPRSVRPSTSPDPAPPSIRPQTTAILSDEGNPSRRKHPLLCICSFIPQTIQQVFSGVHQAIQAGQLSEPSPEGQALLEQWDNLTQGEAIAPSPALLGQFYSRQMFYQEELWHRSAADRKLSEQVATLQLECEGLTNRLRIKDEFLKNVGQEMRTPLTTMKTALTLLESPNLRPPQRQRYMELLTKECDRQSALITSVLDLMQLEDHADHALMQPIRLSDVVPGVVSTYQPLARERGMMLAYTISSDLPAVSCLHKWLSQIVINLLDNAIKFTPPGGEVWVSAKQQGDYIQLEFKDTGVGIAPAELSRVFRPFYRLRGHQEDQSSGPGLGLSMVQQLALNCGGSVSVRSRPGEGSIFHVLLPIYNT